MEDNFYDRIIRKHGETGHFLAHIHTRMKSCEEREERDSVGDGEEAIGTAGRTSLFQ